MLWRRGAAIARRRTSISTATTSTVRPATQCSAPSLPIRLSQVAAVRASPFASATHPNLVNLPSFVASSQALVSNKVGGWAYALVDDPTLVNGYRDYNWGMTQIAPAPGTGPIALCKDRHSGRERHFWQRPEDRGAGRRTMGFHRRRGCSQQVSRRRDDRWFGRQLNGRQRPSHWRRFKARRSSARSAPAR